MLTQVKSGFMMGGRSTPIPATFLDSAHSEESANVSMPGGIASGDLGILFDFAMSATTAPSSVYPSGWTAIGTSQTVTEFSFGLRWNMSYKVLDGTETTLTGMSGGFSTSKLVLVFRKLPALTWGSPASVDAETDLVPGPSDKTVTVGTAPLIVIGVVLNDGTLVMTPAQTATISGSAAANGTLRAGYIIYGAGAANNTVSAGAAEDYCAIGGFYVPLT